MNDISIRLAREVDLDEIEKIYAKAREFMRATGNPTQWGNSYPERELLEQDVKNCWLYLVQKEGKSVGAFVFFVGEEPVYKHIVDGKWKGSGEYGVLHRVASDGSVKGVFDWIYKFAKANSNYIRIDTHEDNIVMQKTLAKYGFKRAGKVYMMDGSERIAYENF